MSNGTDTPFGFKPLGTMTSSQVPLRNMRATAATAGALGRFDLVEQEAAGNLERAAAGSVQIVGSVHGFLFTNTDGYTDWSPYNSAARVATTSVAYHPNTIFLCQGDVTASAVTMEGAQADHVDGAPDSTTFESQQYLNTASLQTTDGGFRILRLYDVPDNVAGDTYARYEVICTEHAWANSTGI